MARLIERVFDPAKPLIVRRFFAGAGRHWNPGDEFPWRQMAVDQRRVRLMFEAGKLTHPETFSTFVQAPVEVVAPVLTPAPSIAQEVQDEDIHRVAVSASDPDGLDDLNMVELRAIAAAEDAPTRVSREAQREAIRENRRGKE
jgi:hypothetical protein